MCFGSLCCMRWIRHVNGHSSFPSDKEKEEQLLRHYRLFYNLQFGHANIKEFCISCVQLHFWNEMIISQEEIRISSCKSKHLKFVFYSVVTRKMSKLLPQQLKSKSITESLSYNRRAAIQYVPTNVIYIWRLHTHPRGNFKTYSLITVQGTVSTSINYLSQFATDEERKLHAIFATV